MDNTSTKNDEGFTFVELLIVIVILGILATVTVFAVRGITEKGKTTAKEAVQAVPVTESIWHMMIKSNMTQVTATDGTPVKEADLVQISCQLAGGKAFYKDTDVFHVPDTAPALTTFKEALGAAGIPVYYWHSGDGGIVDSFVMSTTGLNFPMTTDDARTVITKVVEDTHACDK